MVILTITGGIGRDKPKENKRVRFGGELERVVELCWLEYRNPRPVVEDIRSCLNDATAFRGLRYFERSWFLSSPIVFPMRIFIPFVYLVAQQNRM